MKLKKAIENMGANSAIAIAQEIAENEGISWDDGAKFVFSIIANDLERTPGNIGGQNDTDRDVKKGGFLNIKEALMAEHPNEYPTRLEQ